MKKRALCPLSGVHLTIKPNFLTRKNTAELRKYSIGKNVFLPHCKNRIDLIAEDCSKELSFTYFEQVISCQTTINGSCEDSDLSLNIAYRFVEGE